MKRSMAWGLGILSGLLVLVCADWAVFGWKKDEPVFTVEQASRQSSLRGIVQASGEIQAKVRVNVSPLVTAEIKAIHVEDGQWVKPGDLLVTLDREKHRQELAQVQLSLKDAKQLRLSAESAYKKQKETYQRQEGLYQEGLISEEDYQGHKLTMEDKTAQLEKAKLMVEQAQTRVAMEQDSLSKTLIRASMAGQITGIKAAKGETAIVGMNNVAGSVIMVLSDMTEVLAEVKVGELEVVKLKPGNPAEVQVDAVPGKVFQGDVLDVAASVDRQNMNSGFSQDAQNYRVRVQLKGQKADLQILRPGMSARVAILSQEAKNALSVPLQAVQEKEAKNGGLGLMSGAKNIVYVVKNGKVEERTLKAGVMTRQAVEVLDGVSEGEWVIIGPAKAMASLSSGASVKTQTEAEAIKRRKK